VDAIICFEPVRSEILRSPGGNIVFDSSYIPGEIIDVLIVEKDYIDSHKNQIQELITGWAGATEHSVLHNSGNLMYISGRLGQTPEQFTHSLSLISLLSVNKNLPLLYPKNKESKTIYSDIVKLQNVMKKHHLIKAGSGTMEVSHIFIEHLFGKKINYKSLNLPEKIND
jgi:NitT/TauT family transport system substrate-binding protein